MRYALLGSLALAACGATRVDGEVPRLALPASWANGDGSARGTAGDLTRFWERLGDPVLPALVARALQGNPDLDAARARVRQARARRDLAGAERFPTIGASASYRIGQGGVGQTGVAGVPSSLELRSAGFDASWEPDVSGRRERAFDAARADLEAVGAELGAAQVTLAGEVALNYVELRSFQERLSIARRTVASRAEDLKIAGWRAQAGLVTALDVAQARSSLEQARSLIPPLELGAAEAEHRLAILLGLPPGALAGRLAPAPVPPVPDRVLAGIPAEALRRRPDVRAAERRVVAEAARLGEAEARQYPTLTLSGSLGLEVLNDGPTTLLRSLLAGLVMPIMDSGRIRRQIELQRGVRDEARARYVATALTALEEVENALVALAANRTRRATLERALDAAGSAATLARAQYGAGLVDFQAVLETQRSVLVVEEALATTRAEAAAALIRLYKALGGGWSPEEGA
jgi:NodT family efflux transporter outer membrane factor (OMF) lipoprotein